MRCSLDRLAGWGSLLLALPLRAADLPDLFAERVKSCVTVEFLVENELDRQPVTVLGVCVDANGTIILPASAIGARVSVRQLKDFKVYRPNSVHRLSTPSISARTSSPAGISCAPRRNCAPSWCR